MKKSFLFIMLMLFAGSITAETIKGHVVDSKGTPMPFVTISVLAHDSTLITGAITDEEGKYELSTFNFQLLLSRPPISAIKRLLADRTLCCARKRSNSVRWRSKRRNRLSNVRWINWW